MELNHAYYKGNFLLKRSGESAAELTEALLRPPEVELTHEQKQSVVQFESDLFDVKVGEQSVGEILRAAKPEDLEAPRYFAAYFLQEEVDDDLRKLSPALAEHPRLNTAEDVYTWLATVVDNRQALGLQSEQLLGLAQNSLGYYKQQLAGQLVADTPLEEINPAVLSNRAMVIDPGRTLDQLEAMLRVRAQLLADRRSLRERGAATDPELGAMRAVIDVYLSKTNAEVVTYIPRCFYLKDQLASLPRCELWDRIEVLTGTFGSALEDEDRREQFARWFDYLKYGISSDREGHISTIARALHGREDIVLPQGTAEGLFTPEQEQLLEAYKLTPDQQLEVMTCALEIAGKLSVEDPANADPGRSYRAADGKWQAIFNPTKKTFAVDSLPGLYKVPPVPRSLREVLIVGGAHELEHINQGDAERGVGLRIAELKGKRATALREAGANRQQRRAEVALFGAHQPWPKLLYTRSRAGFEQGGLSGAAKAYYDQKRRVTPYAKPEDMAQEAADRAVRFLRNGGTSQPLVYDEEWVMIDNLQQRDALQERAYSITCFDLPDQLRLHRFGLLPDIQAERFDSLEVILEAARPYIEDALALS